MYFTVNTDFVNYLDSLNNLTDSLKSPILLNRATYVQTLPISLPRPKFYSISLTAHMMLKDFVHQIQQKKEIFDLQRRHTDMELQLPSKNFFFNNYISLLVTTIVINILCKHKKCKTLVASLVLWQIKEVGAVATHESLQYIECTCTIQWYTILMLCISGLGLILLVILKLRKLELFKRHLFLNTVTIMLHILDTKYYIPIKLCKIAGSIHLFKITWK